MTVVLAPGDGIGVEVMAEARKVLEVVIPDVELAEHPIGGTAMVHHGDPLPRETLAAALASEAVLMGACGADDLQWTGGRSPEDGMFELRQALDVYANLRPYTAGGIDLLIVRELVGGLYYGERGVRDDGVVFDTLVYHPSQIERILRRGFELAASRRGKLLSVDKANVLKTSVVWREIATRLAGEYPTVELEHLLVDTAAMKLVQEPERFDVIVTENTFGDILSDVAAAVAGGLGEAASASLTDDGPGLFEPVHGTAPDIAGKGVANPTAMLRSAALMLEHGLGRPEEARRVMEAVSAVAAEHPTRDRGGTAGTVEFGDAVVARLQAVGVPGA
jgi:3-isopropylmalate dehydrogenase